MNTGSFGAAIGGGGSIVQAMQRRGIDASALDQSSMAGMMGASAPTPGPQMGGAMPMPQGASMGAPAGAPVGGVPGAAPNTSESQMIVRALQQRLRDLGEVEKGQAGIGQPAAMGAPPMGGMP